jgi:hypothetical protein
MGGRTHACHLVLGSAKQVKMDSVESGQNQICEFERCNSGYDKTRDSHQEPGPDDVDDDPDSEKDGKYPVCRLHRQNENMSVSRVDRCGI